MPISTELREILRAEMRELRAASQSIADALPTADWSTIASTGEQMRKSYVLEQQLNQAQRDELEALPVHFRLLDAQFHGLTGKLADVARQRDAGLVAFYYSRLLEACAQCHAAYATERFPGFSRGHHDAQHHH